MRIRLILALLFTLLSACATHSQVYSDYETAVREGPIRSRSLEKSKSTVILILVDGLSVPVTQQLLGERKIPNIQQFLLRGAHSFRQGRAGFPTLTYPNISSILTTRDLDDQPIIGNRVLLSGKLYNFESPTEISALSELIRPYSIFSRLEKDRRSAVSFAYFFGDGATARYPTDISAGLAYEIGDYGFVDDRLIDSMKKLLKSTDPVNLPEFIFLHVAGVDALSHKYGPFSRQALAYAAAVDGKLAPVFEEISKAEIRGKKIATLLTADHGFMSTPQFSDIEPLIHQMEPSATLQNQHRLISVNLAPTAAVANRAEIMGQYLSTLAPVQMTAIRQGNEIQIFAHQKKYSLILKNAKCETKTYAVSFQGGPFLCPEQIDRERVAIDGYNYPYLITNLATYFHSPYHPDLIVLAAPGVSFTQADSAGQHGGLSPEEVFVPVLLRNANQREAQDVRRTSELLSFVEKLPTADSTVVGPDTYLPNAKNADDTRNTLEFIVPGSTWNFATKNLANNAEQNLSTSPSLGLGVEFHQYINTLFSTFEGYSFTFDHIQPTSFSTTANLNPSSQFSQALSFGGSYHFGLGQKVITSLGVGQEFFSRPFSLVNLGGADTVDQVWIPEFKFGTQSRLISLGFGDVSLLGNLGVLFPVTTANYSVNVGFSQEFGFKFSRNVGVADEAGVSLKLQHLSQNTSVEDKSEVRLFLELNYELSFQEFFSN